MKKFIISLLLISILLFSGCDAVRSISSTAINTNGELIITYSDGSEDNLGVVVGKDGADGEDGKDGVDGKDGIDGQNGVDGKDGADGKDGIDGKDGADGKDGKDGANGSLSIEGSESAIAHATSYALGSSVLVFCGYDSKIGSNKVYSSGSGVIYELDKETGDAFIITNYHIVYNSDKRASTGISDDISVFIYGKEYEEFAIPAEYVGGSLNYDIAVLRVSGSEILKNEGSHFLHEAEIGDSNAVTIGSDAIAIGNPEGMGIAASYGIISVDSEYIDMMGADDVTEVSFRVMRVDTAVNHGNSGGGLYDSKGHLIGIVNAKLIDSSVDNIGYAIPSNLVVAVTENIIDNCYEKEVKNVRKPMVGITVTPVNFRAVYDTESGLTYLKEDISVVEVSKTGLMLGKLEVGDIIKSATIKEKTFVFTRQYQLLDALLHARVGDEVTFTVLRGDKELSFTVTIREENVIDY